MGANYYLIDALDSNGYVVYQDGQLIPSVIDIM
jgi:hypothetical protein